MSVKRSLSSFVASKTLVIPSSGAVQRVNITGAMFYCKSATGPFQMRYNNGEWFDFDVAFFFDLEGDTFTSLSFRAASGATADSTIVFFAASRKVGTHTNSNVSVTATSTLINELSSCAVESEILIQANSVTGQPTAFAAVGTYFRRIIIIAQKSLDRDPNTASKYVYIGNSSTHQPIALAPGDSYTLEADTGGKRDLGAWFVSADTAGDGVSIIGC